MGRGTMGLAIIYAAFLFRYSKVLIWSGQIWSCCSFEQGIYNTASTLNFQGYVTDTPMGNVNLWMSNFPHKNSPRLLFLVNMPTGSTRWIYHLQFYITNIWPSHAQVSFNKFLFHSPCISQVRRGFSWSRNILHSSAYFPLTDIRYQWLHKELYWNMHK